MKDRGQERFSRGKRTGDRHWARAYRDGRDDELECGKTRLHRSKEDLSPQKREAKRRRRMEPISPEDLRDGLVKEVSSRGCVVLHEGQEVWCTTRGTLKQARRRQSNLVAVGDRVKFIMVGDTEGAVEMVCDRTSKLSRRHSFKDAVEHVMVANADQLVIVASVKQPDLKLGLIDRYIVAAENGRLAPVICINKMDLLGPAEERPDADRLYGPIGYRVLFTSAVTGEGIEALREVLKGRMSVISGHSGVGKTSLLNAVQPGLGLKVREVMEDKTGGGRHTTVRSTLVPLDLGGYVVDTPGIRAFGVWDVARDELAGFFREFVPLATGCRFPGCSHTHEEGCRVKEAVEKGIVDARRYAHYLSIRESL